MRDGPPPIYRMPRCRACPRFCKPCLTLSEAKEVQDLREYYAANGNAWQAETVCDACHKKSNRRQNEIIAERNGRGKPKGKLAQIQALLDALDECQRVGYQMADSELSQLNAKMKQLGIG